MTRDFWEGYVPEPVKPAPVQEMDKTVDMAREAGAADITSHGWTSWVGTQSTEFLKRFEALVRADEREKTNRRANASWALMCEKMVAAEREACAKVCDSLEEQCEKLGMPDEKWPTPADCAAVIRTRGNT